MAEETADDGAGVHRGVPAVRGADAGTDRERLYRCVCGGDGSRSGGAARRRRDQGRGGKGREKTKGA